MVETYGLLHSFEAILDYFDGTFAFHLRLEFRNGFLGDVADQEGFVTTHFGA